MSDSYFLSTVPLVHSLLPFPQMAHLYSEELEMSLDSPGDQKVSEISMMTSLSRMIYFHLPEFAADDWMCNEMDCPWSGEGRGLVTSRTYTRDWKLIATCRQEVRNNPFERRQG
jgi:acyl-CoA thioesterase